MTLRRVAQRTGLHIVAGTSFYVEPAHPPYVQEKSVQELGDLIAQAVTTGIEGSEVRAGIIGEVGTTSVSPAAAKPLAEVHDEAARLWQDPRVLMTPHVSGGSDESHNRGIDIFCDNLRAYLAGTPLRNVIDWQRAY